jgi:asparagine synthase (glutamine-hydrolysing)
MVAKSVQSRWLRREALENHARRVAADEAAEPLRYDAGTWFITRRRSFATISHNHAAVAAEYELKARDPLLDSGFLAALARAGGALGYSSRTATMTALFSDVLPPVILTRSTKAWFNEAHTGPATRDFARSWDGSGVDHGLVDADRLRSVWLSDEPTMAAGMLLHSAWLAAEERSS